MARILVVDDEQKMLVLCRDILTNEGFDVLTAGNAEDGLRLAMESTPDLILLDVMMPEMDGGQMAQELKQKDKTKNIPIIFLTSIITEEEVIKTGGDISGHIFMSKSTNKKELIKKINEVLAAENK